ncbi:MAG: prephenate dehydrogenase/arogenate dehydrogenase family protein, partial [Flavobacteriaceae bacterium]|nr:prephenate dehydrogenase/arogenate dehydrogenase family protein [Flavobacteriaceae bacterium]
MKKIAVIGLGLIGGSMALELKKLTWATIYGIDNNPEHLQKAHELGLIFEKADLSIVKEVDVVIIAVPVNAIPTLTSKVLDLVEKDTLVFDVGSVKTEVCTTVANHPNRKNFVAAHPIAGTEFSGPEAAIY